MSSAATGRGARARRPLRQAPCYGLAAARAAAATATAAAADCGGGSGAAAVTGHRAVRAQPPPPPEREAGMWEPRHWKEGGTGAPREGGGPPPLVFRGRLGG